MIKGNSSHIGSRPSPAITTHDPNLAPHEKPTRITLSASLVRYSEMLGAALA
jgi:hypothetical protein